ncbi:MAG: Asp23/Gls24 family envelope stress response protein [Bacillota bacterium]
MRVYALVGQSGTGKSYKAFMVAKDREIEYIIDDGLLIGGTRVVAGKSAKREGTKLASIRRALFRDSEHMLAVRKALNDIKPDKLLIIGTSDKMIEEIVRTLGLNKIDEIIRIDDISTEKEIEIARKSRKEDGKHVIPVPTVEIKKDFSGYFIDSLKIFSKKDKVYDVEKTIIRPTFSYLGKYEISKNVLIQMINHCCMSFERISKLHRGKIDNNPSGIIINLEISIKLISQIDKMIEELQRKIIDNIEYMTGLNVLSVNVTVKSITK